MRPSASTGTYLVWELRTTAVNGGARAGMRQEAHDLGFFAAHEVDTPDVTQGGFGGVGVLDAADEQQLDVGGEYRRVAHGHHTRGEFGEPRRSDQMGDLQQSDFGRDHAGGDGTRQVLHPEAGVPDGMFEYLRQPFPQDPPGAGDGGVADTDLSASLGDDVQRCVQHVDPGVRRSAVDGGKMHGGFSGTRPMRAGRITRGNRL